MNVTSPDISTLDFNVTYDLTTVTPKITITNNSTGSNLAGCKWWLKLTTPSGTYIHNGNSASPDKTGVWAPWLLPDIWPQPFGHIEWSGNPYVATLYVQDAQVTPNEFSFSKQTYITTPAGNSGKDNFGGATVGSLLQCSEGKLIVTEKSPTEWNGIQGTITSQEVKLIYPPGPDDTTPAPVAITGSSNVIFDISYDSDCYILVTYKIIEYEFPNDTTVLIKYKAKQVLNIACSTELCSLICSYNKFIKNSDPDINSKSLSEINGLFLQAIIGKMEPACGIQVGEVVAELKDRLDAAGCGCGA